ncbi:MAG: CCA tRNA nucleotidyltransferase [Desulfurococcaceae archaeon]
MSRLTKLEEEVLEKIKPKPHEYKIVLEAYEILRNELDRVLRRYGVEGEITLQGSIAHDTWLAGDRDIDIFVLYPENWSRGDLEDKGFNIILEAARIIGNYETRYAEHPYVRVKVGEVLADIVPALKIRDPRSIKTAVDRTPFHTMYVNSKLNSELRDHVRLLKKFMKGIGVYGAEIKTRGFSGYVAELLVITYGGFREVLEAASTWKQNVFINSLGPRLTEDFKELLKSRYPDSCIYLPDPVDPLRNVTASVSLKSLFTFILASKCYLKNSSEVFFEERVEANKEALIRSLENRCIVFIEYYLEKELPPDVLWGEAWRTAHTLSKIIKQLDVNLIDYSAWTNERDVIVIAIELDHCQLSGFKLFTGPCIGDSDERLYRFIVKHIGRGLGPWIDQKGCLDSLDPRKELSIASVLGNKWMDYTVSSHLRVVKPVIEYATAYTVNKLIEIGANKWLQGFVLKTPNWMEKCISS